MLHRIGHNGEIFPFGTNRKPLVVARHADLAEAAVGGLHRTHSRPPTRLNS
jgi:hypothetical protein